MEESLDDVLLNSEEKMEKAAEHLHHELSGLRTGKASPSMVENITVEYYGATTRLRDVSVISIPEPRLLVIKPFEPSLLQAIDKAILAANIGITPISDGRVVRVPVPELSEERRKDLVKVAHRATEQARIAIRNIRREANESIKTLQKDSAITEDEREGGLGEIQKLTDTYTKKVDDLLAAKEKDVLAI
jgi:ribosome recycling factor